MPSASVGSSRCVVTYALRSGRYAYAATTIAAASATPLATVRSRQRRASATTTPPNRMSTVVLSIATAPPASTIPVASARGSPRSAQRTASATAANATAKPSGCTSAYVARNHTVCANENVQRPQRGDRRGAACARHGRERVDSRRNGAERQQMRPYPADHDVAGEAGRIWDPRDQNPLLGGPRAPKAARR